MTLSSMIASYMEDLCPTCLTPIDMACKPECPRMKEQALLLERMYIGDANSSS